MDAWISRVADKLAHLRLVDTDLRAGGMAAADHRYRLGPVLSVEELAAAESHYGISLPEDYRQFLLNIGNGGAGPGYGLERFGAFGVTHPYPEPAGCEETRMLEFIEETSTWQDEQGQIVDSMHGQFYWAMSELADDPGSLARSFPFTESVEVVYEGRRSKEGELLDIEEYDRKYDVLVNACGEGNFCLAHYGCGILVKLIVTGDERGHLWISDLANSDRIAKYVEFYERDGPSTSAPYTFVQWYEDWLDSSIRHAETVATSPVSKDGGGSVTYFRC